MNKVGEVSNLKVPALGRGVALLEAVAREPGLGFTGIQERLGMPKSSTHHLISTMCELGLIKRRSLGGYGLGLRLFELAGIANESNDLQRDAMPILRDFAKRVQLTCHLGVLEQNEAVYLARVEGARDIIVKSHVGQRFPVNCSALGKSLIAWMPPELLDIVIASLAFEKRMPKTVMSAAGLRLQLADVRRRGWAIDDEEQAPNCRCIAAPIRDRDGMVIAAISAVGTLEQVEDKRFDALAAQVMAAANAISESVYCTSADITKPPKSRAAKSREKGR
ncbi:IclR family transcriptional regulator [Lichenicola cladoniae]|uniref:IclR family transcriptional regulator n=1 Tax=Lichenicola cladoniae TaxID=1484109 RepID=A0A6M8HRL8_9PROT|nr:IclR family transcriptional regulator [Lichenicola cladoniae]NPD69090.1 IclR family transcriptional regulator [Acetobacteraceae bacterium]QKE90915.1 IclR family transcriptional regulator [Lichenicola cladoniae]